MREIKFRGKRIDNGEWVYGAFVPDALETPDNDLTTWGFIRRYNRDIGKMETIEVARESVGQYTGLCDKNGKEIYERDVLLWGDDNRQNQVVFSQGSFQMQRYGGLAPLRYHNLVNSEAMNAEVIGNIHDNPELLEVTE